MNRLVCDDCGATFYSAAASTLEEEGARCEVCGGALRWVRDRPADDAVAVAANHAPGEER